ncbi:MAG: wax ester/triacylglycerol synthase family O-acyltransferase [Actinomycetia bacterium]|nr:wax ester/triacylglycerol synthase family O-acyltransferase [Actinomycetes bacterium]
MKQLSGLDAGFLYMETPTTFGHISSLSVYDKPDKDSENPYEILRGRLEQRLPLLEPLRRRLVEVPFQLDHPWWIEDPDFDLEFHVRHIAVPGSGGPRELSDLVGRLISRPLDRTRPLWEAYAIEGLRKGRWAAFIKMHHATIDGAAGALMTMMLLDAEAGAEPPPMPETPPTEAVPTPLEMMGRTMMRYTSRPQRFFAAQNRMMGDLLRIATNNANQARSMWSFPKPGRADSAAGASRSLVSPRTPFNKSISPHRRFAYRSFSLDDAKAVKNHFEASINDVVMAACAGALRRYLVRHEALPDQPLVAMVPVSIRTGEEEDMWTNRVSSIFSRLPTHIDDAAERVRYARDAMESAKSSFDLVPTESVIDFAQFASPALVSQAAGLMTRTHLANQVRQPSNVVISNVPGPRQALYMGSARLRHYYPVSTIAEGQGLNITVQSYEDKLDLGLVGCRELLPDLWHLIDDFEVEIAELVALTDSGPDAEVEAEAG